MHFAKSNGAWPASVPLSLPGLMLWLELALVLPQRLLLLLPLPLPLLPTLLLLPLLLPLLLLLLRLLLLLLLLLLFLGLLMVALPPLARAGFFAALGCVDGAAMEFLDRFVAGKICVIFCLGLLLHIKYKFLHVANM